ncbi:MAG TPA: PspC domain-containing protein [Allosphingosinicella sp.]|nr:PspC domain-containing protein [Allosphingosinicella sp.]
MFRGRKFYLDRANGKVVGVCAGLANYTGWDPTLIRVGLVLVTLAGAFPWTVIAYGVAAFLAKNRPLGQVEEADAPRLKTSTAELRDSMRDIDHRMAEVETFVTSSNTRLAQEIDSLR